MIGGILCERTVQEITPTLISNKEQVRVTSMYNLKIRSKLTNQTSISNFFFIYLFSTVDEGDRGVERTIGKEGCGDKRIQRKAQYQDQRTRRTPTTRRRRETSEEKRYRRQSHRSLMSIVYYHIPPLPLSPLRRTIRTFFHRSFFFSFLTFKYYYYYITPSNKYEK